MHVLSRKYEAGVSLIEILITMTILAFGLLGIAGLQTSSVANTYTSYQYGQAAVLAQSMLEKLRANRTATLAGTYNLSVGTAPTAPTKDCSAVTCSPTELAAWDLAVWYSMIADTSASPYTKIPKGPLAALPSGNASITCQDATCVDNSVRLITIYWDANRNGATGTKCDPTSSTDLSCFRLAYVP